MILGASHITLGCDDVAGATMALGRYGYQPEFLNTDLANDTSKRPYMSAWSDVHTISLLRAARGFPIELIQYASRLPDVYGRYVGIFDGLVPAEKRVDASLAPVGDIGTAIGSPLVDAVMPDAQMAALFLAQPRDHAGLTHVALAVDNLDAALRFWCDGMGFGCGAVRGRVASLALRAPVPAWRLNLVLFENASRSRASFLDARGMACVAFISSDIEADTDRLSGCGAAPATRLFEIVVNGKRLRVRVLILDGAFIELIQIMQRPGGLSN